MILYHAASSLVFFLLFVVWTKKEWLNFFLKLMFLGLSIWGAVLFLAMSKLITINI